MIRQSGDEQVHTQPGPRPGASAGQDDKAATGARRLSVLIADDHALLRFIVRQLLEHSEGIGKVGEAQTTDQVLDALASEKWDVVVLDIDMSGRHSMHLLEWIREHHPRVAVLMLSMYPEELFGLRTLRAGAAGYLCKSAGPEQLLNAILRVGEGGAYISANLAGSLVTQRPEGADETAGNRLSGRERAVLSGLVRGESVAAIARELQLSRNTVSTYRARLLEKFNLRSNIELANFAREQKLLD
jgi:DNA-binding NarL/FixJ family response regulator